MIHYTCDRCKRSINTPDQPRYVVQVTIHSLGQVDGASKIAAEFGEDQPKELFDEEGDALTDLHETLQQSEMEVVCDEREQLRQDCFDLCECCHQEFLESPLGREVLATMGLFSEN